MHRNPARFGFKSVTTANNAAHLSAGPFEAVFELSNFLSAVPRLNFEIGVTRQARHLKSQGLSVSDLRRAIDNPSACLANAPSCDIVIRCYGRMRCQLEPPCSASFSFEIQQPPIWTNISRALRDFEAQTKARGFWSEVQRVYENRIWTSLPSSLRIPWNGVLKPKHFLGVRLAVMTMSWISSSDSRSMSM